MKRIERYSMDVDDYPYSHHVPMDLRGGVRTYVDVDSLPISDKQKALVLSVQGLDTKKEQYCLAHHKDKQGRLLVTIKGLGELDGYRVDLLSGKVYDASGRHEVKPVYHRNKAGQPMYLRLSGSRIDLHRIVALTWLRISGQLSLLDQAMENPSAYPAHHREPWLKLSQRGNNVFNVEILPAKVHYQYESIVTQLAAKYKRGEVNIDKSSEIIVFD
ncbi:hypothetical protein [Limosilactobacillus oris]|uniref:hypothetical protein n=1 Tax=Limosilactobacillus oris TaxID=1632 RepID=UPI0018837386|nr:hypothetical protein [Limosilactobacillus oris]MBF0602016.1 hypothetical protein [Limosilactobacillus oris]